MAWRNAKALDTLKGEITEAYPGRKPGSLQTIGDPNHSSRDSQHNPNPAGVVTAIDVMNDTAGPDPDWLADYLVDLGKSGDARIWYVVWDRKIWSRTYGWVTRAYTGSDPHTSHVHMSLWQTSAAYDSTAPWGLEDSVALSDADIKKIADAVWNRNVQNYITPPDSQADTELSRIHQRTFETKALVEAIAAQQMTTAEIAEVINAAIAKGIDIEVTVTPGD
jgi:hypothetical protein